MSATRWARRISIAPRPSPPRSGAAEVLAADCQIRYGRRPNRPGRGEETRMPGACAGLRVLELSDGLAGSLASMVLADFGAEVIRIEPTNGDAFWDEPVALLVHRGKKSIDLDLGSPEGRDHFHTLVRGSDVVIDSLGAQHAADPALGYDALAAL